MGSASRTRPSARGGPRRIALPVGNRRPRRVGDDARRRRKRGILRANPIWPGVCHFKKRLAALDLSRFGRLSGDLTRFGVALGSLQSVISLWPEVAGGASGGWAAIAKCSPPSPLPLATDARRRRKTRNLTSEPNLAWHVALLKKGLAALMDLSRFGRLFGGLDKVGARRIIGRRGCLA